MTRADHIAEWAINSVREGDGLSAINEIDKLRAMWNECDLERERLLAEVRRLEGES
jgi:hypothetical protein